MRALNYLTHLVIFALLLTATSANAQVDALEQGERIAESPRRDREMFKLHFGFSPYTLVMESIDDPYVRGGGLVGILDLGAGVQLGGRWMLSAHVAFGFGASATGEVAFSLRGWSQSGLMLWGGGGYTVVPVWCEGDAVLNCPPSPEAHGPFTAWQHASGPMLHAGLGYRWTFSDDEWAFMLGVGEGLANLRYNPDDHPDATAAELETVAGWYVSMPMVRYFLEW